jgi:hypothetical protein
MARLLSILLVLGLLGGTAAAFAITEGLKLEKSPIAGTRITKLFSPTCDCPTDVASVSFRLRHGDTVTAKVVTSQGGTVATLANHYFRRGTVDPPLLWNGRDQTGNVVPDGLYKLRIHLKNRHQTITLPNTIQVKTTAPTITIKRVVPRVFSPDHDGRSDYVTISYTVSASARPLLDVNGRQVGRGRLTRASGRLHWYGGAHGERYGPGVYRLSLRAEDRAGNVSPPTNDVLVRLRYVALGREVVHVRPGARFAVRVSSDAKLVHWLLRGRTGEEAPGTLRFRAPKKPGRYKLFVTAVGHPVVALVVVSKR